MLRAPLALLVLLSPPPPDLAMAEADPCEVIVNAEGRILQKAAAGDEYARMWELRDDRLKIGVAIGAVEAPAELVMEIVTDHQRFPEIFPYVRESNVRDGVAGALQVYQNLDLPFPIANRRYEITVEPIRARRTAQGTRCLESHWTYVLGSGNIEDTWGHWEVLERRPGSAFVAYVAYVDPGGRLPSWAVNWASRQALPRVIESLRAEAERRQRSE